MELKVLRQLNFPIKKLQLIGNENGDLESARKPWEFIPAGHKIGTPEPIFKELVCTLLALSPSTFNLVFGLVFHWFIGLSYCLWHRNMKMWSCSGTSLPEARQIGL